jgi:hypothetical protein
VKVLMTPVASATLRHWPQTQALQPSSDPPARWTQGSETSDADAEIRMSYQGGSGFGPRGDDRDGEKADKKDKKDPITTKITQQFRERHNMTYELQCAGTPLVLRMYPSDGDIVDAPAGTPEEWRVEARRTDAPDAVVATASAATRAEALRKVGEWCRENHASGLSSLDWDAVVRALTLVKAL